MKILEIQEWGSTEPFLLSDLTDADIQVLRRWAANTRFYDLVFDHKSLRLKANGRIGQCLLPLPHYGPVLLYIQTKVPVVCLLEWWCWSEGLIETDSYLVPLETLDDIIEQLACWLAQRVLDQARRGMLSAYQRQTRPLASPKGRLLIRPSAMALARGQTELVCQYEERTQDIPENQVLFWTLDCLRRQGLQHQQARRLVRSAHRVLQGSLSLEAFSAKDCYAFTYNRLNRHYEPVHRLCGMILSQISIGQANGAQDSHNFMLMMHQVFEGAVVKALRHVCKGQVQVIAQEPHSFSSEPAVRALMDIVIRDAQSQQPLLVLDTKYKQGNSPSNSDIYQMISYSSALNVFQGYLLFPQVLDTALQCQLGSIWCYSMAVPMDRPVLEAVAPLEQLIAECRILSN